MTRPLGVAALVLAVLVSAAHAEPVQITIAPPAEATTMDPGRSTQVLTVNYFVNLYDTLTRWDAALRLQPGLATSWRNVNDTTWELTLRPGVKFHDGSPLTAEDVKATLERNLLPGKTVVQAGFATIESIQAVTPTAVRIVTKKPDPLLLGRLAQMGAQILPARQTTDEGVKALARRPVGTGAYRFVSRDYCFTETPRTTNPGFVATNGTSRLLSVRTKSKLSVPVPPVRIVQTADPVPLGFTVYVHVKVWWSTTPPALRVRTPSVRLPLPSASKTPTAATGTAVVPLMMVPSRENP